MTEGNDLGALTIIGLLQNGAFLFLPFSPRRSLFAAEKADDDDDDEDGEESDKDGEKNDEQVDFDRSGLIGVKGG